MLAGFVQEAEAHVQPQRPVKPGASLSTGPKARRQTTPRRSSGRWGTGDTHRCIGKGHNRKGESIQ